MAAFVDVAVPLGVRRTFAYSVPPHLQSQMAPGIRVLVPFGRKTLTGVVVALLRESPTGNFEIRAIKDALDRLPLIPAALVETARWVADRYFTPAGEILRSMLPAGAQVSGAERIRVTPGTERLLAGGLYPGSVQRQERLLLDTLYRHGPLTVRQLEKNSGQSELNHWIQSLAVAGWVRIEETAGKPRASAKEQLGIRALKASQETLERLTAGQRALYSLLEQNGRNVPLQSALRSAGVTAGVAHSLQKRGLVEIKQIPILRVPEELSEVADSAVRVLTKSQQTVFDELRAGLACAGARRYLLHGVTGSGKTEIYLRLIGEALKSDYTAMLLVPEIGLTPLLSRIAVSHFPDRVALLHSAMSLGERYDQWNRIRSGFAPVVVGTRSAVFAPLENLRLIIIDEEQDPSYKQDESPYYHAREVAWHRIQRSGGLLLLGSATPSVETFHAARENGEIVYLCLPERIHARPLPEAVVVDMGLEFQRYGKQVIISHLLGQELGDTLSRGQQAIVLLNRRGYSRTLLCRGCGHAYTCTECSVSMTYHQAEQRLICHYCGLERDTPSTCSSCGGEYIYFVGAGTEQLEEALRAMFPGARIARLDRDATRKKGTLRKTLTAFQQGRLDILVGTQMLAKGHDFPNVTLVGVIAADAGLAFPDFRSAERTFQLLTQVAGRAGRGEAPGKVVIQSFYPDHYALKFARRQDYSGFFGHEIEFRKLMSYPPYTRLIQIIVSHGAAATACDVAEQIGAGLKAQALRRDFTSQVRILGPAPAPLEKLRGKFRYQILIKAKPACDAVSLLGAAYEELGARRVALKHSSVDVDPLSLM